MTLLFLSATGGLVAQPFPQGIVRGRPAFVPGELLVTYRAGVSSAAAEASVYARTGGSVRERLRGGRVQRVILPPTADVLQSAADLMADPNVEYAEPNHIAYATTSPNDPSFGQLWGHSNSAQTITDPMDTNDLYGTSNPGTSGRDMNLTTAWDVRTDCSSVIVAVIDSGVNYNHEDLSANMWDGSSCKTETGAALGSCTSGYDYVSDDKIPMDLNGHGTHVAGTVGARGNNGVGVAGVCWTIQLMAVRVLGTDGSGTAANISKGLDFARQNGAKVVNMSLGMSSSNATLSTAITNARTAGMLVVVAAGNDGLNLGVGGNDAYPCEFTHDNLICVAALDQAYGLTSFSNYGSSSVDVGAPGANILSTWAGSQATTTDDFTSGWTFSGGWGRDTNTFYCPSTPGVALSNPSDFCSSSAGFYGINLTAQASKQYTISSSQAVLLSLYLDYFLGDSGDSLAVYADTDGGPFDGTQVKSFTGAATYGNGTYYPLGVDLSAVCGSSTTCDVGFQLTTDGTSSSSSWGVAILGGAAYALKTIDTASTDRYDTINGTSMASPQVAGLAALVWAQNPGYGYLDVKEAIFSGGDVAGSLSGKSTQSRSVNANTSVRYIQKVTGVGVTVL